MQHGGEVPDQAWDGAPRLVVSSSRGAACWPKFGGIKERAPARVSPSTGGWEELCACRGVGGDVPGPWPGHRHARITQRRRVGELEPKLYFLAVGGQFHELVKRRKNRLRASRARSGGASGRAQPVGHIGGKKIIIRSLIRFLREFLSENFGWPRGPLIRRALG